MKRSNFFICDYNQWIYLNDPRVTSLSEEFFTDMLKNFCQKYDPKFPQLYKKLISTDPYCIINASTMSEKNFYFDNTIDPINWKVFPDRRKSLTCFNYKENDPGNLYIVIPYDGANFGICPGAYFSECVIKESKDLIEQGFTRAYYNNPIEWLKGLNKRELWTDDSCLLISQQQWENFFKK
jgi:hypothetical protein